MSDDGRRLIVDLTDAEYDEHTITIPRPQHEALMAAAKLNDRARLLLNIAFGEFACTSKYLPAEERAQFEKNYAVDARALIGTIHESEAALRTVGIDLEEKHD